MRRATFVDRTHSAELTFQFTPVMRRATDRCGACRPRKQVSIHARHARATGSWRRSGAAGAFQFTPVMRRATWPTRSWHGALSFNSRPSCDGRPNASDGGHGLKRFNSRPSCDGRRRGSRFAWVDTAFQFTPVMRRATGSRARHGPVSPVSIHARHATGDHRSLKISLG